MKTTVTTILSLLFVAATLTSCRETEKETTTIVKEVEVQAEETEGILERTAKEIDKEVNEEIDEEIEKIGNDDAS